jgi:hypothetical protein
MRISIHAEVNLAPPPVRSDTVFPIEPFAFAVNFETRAVDKKMKWLVAVDVNRQYRQTAAASTEGGVIRNGDVDPEHIGDRTKQPFSLTERLVEHQAEREGGLNRDRRIDRLTTPAPVAGACQAAKASSVNQTVMAPRRTNAASYSGQFVTRYLAVGILWRRLSQNLYGMGFHSQGRWTIQFTLRSGGQPCHPSRPSTRRPRAVSARGTIPRHNLRSIPAPTRLYEAFPAPEAHRVLQRLECHYMPKHASWLNMVEIEIGVLRGQCLDRRIGERDVLVSEIDAWQRQRNASGARVKWKITTQKARHKLARAYPDIAKAS